MNLKEKTPIKKKRKYYMKCQYCNKNKKNTIITNDPYAREINNVEIKMKLCSECYHQRCQDI